MKRFKFNALLWLPLSGLLIACTDNPEPDPCPDPIPNPGTEEKFADLISGMEEMEDLSTFTRFFKGMNTDTWKDDEELTVFAFTNQAVTRDVGPSSVPQELMERHLVKGKYTREQLRKETSILSVNGSVLSIQVDDQGKVYINGVELEEENILPEYAIYTVGRIVPEIVDITRGYVFKVYEYFLSDDGAVVRTLATEAEISFYDEELNHLLDIYTDPNGIASLTDLQNNYAGFIAYSLPSGYTNLYNGWLVTGVFTSREEIDNYPAYASVDKYIGGPKLADRDGDGIISDSDKVEYVSLDKETHYIEVHLVQRYLSTAEPDYPDPEEMIQTCKDKFESFHDLYLEYSSQLATWEQRKQINSADHRISHFFSEAYHLIHVTNNILNHAEQRPEIWQAFTAELWLCRAFRAQAHLYLTQFYGDIPLLPRILSIDESFLITRTPMAEVHDFVRAELTEASQHIKQADLKYMEEDRIVFELWMENYTEAAEQCTYLIHRNAEMSDAIYLYNAEAQLASGNPVQALTSVNLFHEKNGREPLTSVSLAEIQPLYETYGLSNPMANNLRWGVMNTWELKFRLLPIPIHEINMNPNLTQNPGW
ncbi:MAG: RagB/SusD family nutrient uptake outer membrane protein [Bacteroides sp.]|nr:RagB/SusD family nutrient uptake outer membrane protein [Bacteroides sp.]